MKKLDAGMIGLSVMGRNLVLNLCDHGYQIGGFNRSSSVTEEMITHSPHDNFTPYFYLEDLIRALKRPRRLFLMIKAGDPVDAVLSQALPLLEPGDIVLDCGNSHVTDTERRFRQAREHGIHYFGTGVSGGEEGARNGPAIMPGGDAEIYEKELRGMLEAIAAKAPDGTPCCSYMGQGGAGHFVKMVHNGIEYADMQLIAESYLLLKQVGGLDNQQLSDVFAQWNKGELESYLIDITAHILKEPDDLGPGELLDYIEDSAGQKGTGRWTSMEALEKGIHISMISAAKDARLLSNDLPLRHATAGILSGPELTVSTHPQDYAKTVGQALYAAKILAYAQGFALLMKAGKEYGWNLDLGRIAGVFRAGCIIRAAFLDEIIKAYDENPELTHLTHTPFFAQRLNANQHSLRVAAADAVMNGLPAPVYFNAVSFLDGLRGAPVGANLLQAQRDYFGAHTFRRTDREGIFHHDWGYEGE